MKNYHISVWFCVFFLLQGLSTSGQSVTISLEEAIQRVMKNYPAIRQKALEVEKYNTLSEGGLPTQPTQIFFTGEEFGPNNGSGVQSFNIQQNFYLPKASRATSHWYTSQSALATKEMALTKAGLTRELALSYLEAVIASKRKVVAQENINLYREFNEIAAVLSKEGETGKIPVVAAVSRLSRAALEKQEAQSAYYIATRHFNHWLLSDTLFTVSDTLEKVDTILFTQAEDANPHLEVIRAGEAVADSKIAVAEAQLLPQINSGIRLQSAFGTFPLFGYQAGINIPLFKKGYQKQIDAAKVEVAQQKATLETKELKLERTLSDIIYRLNAQVKNLRFMEEELLPLLEEQNALNKLAYKEGEISYLEYLDGLEQQISIKKEILEATYTTHYLKIELAYWQGR